MEVGLEQEAWGAVHEVARYGATILTAVDALGLTKQQM